MFNKNNKLGISINKKKEIYINITLEKFNNKQNIIRGKMFIFNVNGCC